MGGTAEFASRRRESQTHQLTPLKQLTPLVKQLKQLKQLTPLVKQLKKLKKLRASSECPRPHVI